MTRTKQEILDFVEEHDIQFIRLTFTNLAGIQKNIAVMASELPSVLEHGYHLDSNLVEGFLPRGNHDVALHPDLDTLTTLPWRPLSGGVARLLCATRYETGEICPDDGRELLRKVCAELDAAGYRCEISSHVEFYLLSRDEEGKPTRRPMDQAGFCDIAPRDKGENARREICLALREMGMLPQSSHHERGPGQNEIALAPCDPLSAADALVNFHSVAEIIAERSGLFACFDPKPFSQYNGSNVQLDIALYKQGEELMRGHAEADCFTAGIAHHLRDITSFLNTHRDSYNRFGADIDKAVRLSYCNDNASLRVMEDGPFPHLEMRTADPSLSPYLSLALLLRAGLDGIAQQRKPERIPPLPESLAEAEKYSRESALVTGLLSQGVLETYFRSL